MGVDAARRFIRVRLVKNQMTKMTSGQPSFRITDIEQYVGDNRARILSALGRIALDWVADGAPVRETGLSLPSFEAFSRTVGACLQHAGVEGWGRNALDMVRNMQALDEWVPFCFEWYREHKLSAESRTKAVSAGDLYNFAQKKGLLGYVLSFAKDEASKRSYLGTKLSYMRDAPVGDFIIRVEWNDHRKTNRYWLERVEGSDEPEPVTPGKALH
jgi:hypothetical protein